VVDETGAVKHQRMLGAFGVPVSVGTGGDQPVNYERYGGVWGYRTDPLGLLQLGARFYWPEVGRFVQQDPIGDGDNWYAYAENNPLVWIDPEGFGAWSDFSDWYMGGMGGASDWADQNLFGGATAGFGNTAGQWDSGTASGWGVAGQACLWGGQLAATGAGAYGLGKGAVVGASRAPATIAAARTKGVAGAARALTKGKVGLDLGRAARPLSRDLLCKTGMPRKTAGALHQAQTKIPHVNLGPYHGIVNRYNWYRPWKWFIKGNE